MEATSCGSSKSRWDPLGVGLLSPTLFCKPCGRWGWGKGRGRVMHGSPLPPSGNKLFWAATGTWDLILLAVHSSSNQNLKVKDDLTRVLRLRKVKFFATHDRLYVLKPTKSNVKEHLDSPWFVQSPVNVENQGQVATFYKLQSNAYMMQAVCPTPFLPSSVFVAKQESQCPTHSEAKQQQNDVGGGTKGLLWGHERRWMANALKTPNS